MADAVQPIGECRTRDTGTTDGDSHNQALFVPRFAFAPFLGLLRVCSLMSQAATGFARRAESKSPSAAQTMLPLTRMLRLHAKSLALRKPASSARSRRTSRILSRWPIHALPMRPSAPTSKSTLTNEQAS